ncbi:alkaline phosphatase D family protein [Ruegeria marina]|uniref:Alkaline phosphatase D n=1 Tax=Ruegeria marina TaxID=639004 RepID=A0A1G7FIC5_9RHOB|nr:alkaline phosphatase D family protein [Ruegeria marina]SDE75653.1 alkaline phosphatase D [Ruegeria marina]
MLTRRLFLSSAAAAGMSVAPLSQAMGQQANQTISRIAFGSCAKQWEPQPIWNTIARREPDLFLSLGDAIYGDWHGDEVFTATEESLRADWEQLAAIPEFAAFREQFKILATWDNHDFGKHDGGAEFELKEQSKKLFLDFLGEPQNTERRNRPGIYDAMIYGPEGRRVQIILLDCRTFKSPYTSDQRSVEEKAALNIRGQYLPSTDTNATLLGATQWQWLEEQLQEPAELRLIASGTQIVADEKAMEEWGNFPAERRKLFDLIGKTGAEGVILLSGNVHFSEVSRTDEGPYPLTDFTSSGLTHSTPAYAELKNSRRVAGPFTGFNFGEINIRWEDTEGTIVELTCLDSEGSVQFEHIVQLSALKVT